MSAAPRDCERVLMVVPVTFKTLIDAWAKEAGVKSTDYIADVLVPSWKKEV